MITIKGGQVLAPAGWILADVAVEDGRVSGIGSGLSAGEVIDATGCLVGPGFVDMHTHLRDPGQTWKEDISSGSEAGACGGFTAITAMPNTDPPMDTVKVVESVLIAGDDVDLVDVVPSAALTVGRSGAILTDIEELYRAGVRIFTDDGDCLTDESLLEEAMKNVASLPGAVLAQHAEEHSQTIGGQMHEGLTSRRLGMGGLPSAAESDVVKRDIELVARTGVRYHCQHVSSRDTVEVIRTAKDSGLRVTAEVTPHHLIFDESSLEDLDPDFKMYPPLRSTEDRRALVHALRDGTIDAVATDHAPHLPTEKKVPFVDAPRGAIGLETAASAVWEVLSDRDRFFDTMSVAPAQILGLARHGQPIQPGSPANLVVFDPDASWVPGEFRSKSSNSPFRGRVMTGRVTATMRRGRLTYQHETEVG